MNSMNVALYSVLCSMKPTDNSDALNIYSLGFHTSLQLLTAQLFCVYSLPFTIMEFLCHAFHAKNVSLLCLLLHVTDGGTDEITITPAVDSCYRNRQLC